MQTQQPSLFEGERLRLNDAIQLSLASLSAYGSQYRHWALAYSGGKDSSATLAFVAWAIKSGLVTAPESLTVLYADTRMELPPLQRGAMRMLDALRADGFDAQVVLPALDERFYVYMLGRGVPPPSNTFRWCTGKIKVEPMLAALQALRAQTGHKLLMLTGVRLGESAARDQRIALSCSRDSGECGQGWFQTATPEAVADRLAPLLHWRLCHVYDWLYFDERHGYDARAIAAVYGDGDVRTGCVGCNLASRDTALERLIRHPEWQHLTPLLELKPLYAELKQPRWRKRKAAPELRQDGKFSVNGQRMGPLTMAGRAYGLERLLAIQQRAGVDLINTEEQARIREMWRLNVWPQKWSEADIAADVPLKRIAVIDNALVETALLFEGEA
jgi:DNA sulfur modification protein DndC